MEDYKTYKQYYINSRTFTERETLKNINTILKLKNIDLQNMEEWKKNRLAEHLTNKQYQLFKNNELKELKKILRRYKEKAKNNLQAATEKAKESYNDIKALKDIKKATFEIEWSKTRGAYGYQCKCYSKIEYKNGSYNYYESEKTSGCGYDKASSALSYNMNKTCKILLVKYGNKILKDTNKHYNCYACENLYFSYGVGVNSYKSMFEYFGFKTNVIYHNNEDITIFIEK